MNASRVPYEAHTSVVGYASEGSARRSLWSRNALQGAGNDFGPWGYTINTNYIINSGQASRDNPSSGCWKMVSEEIEIKEKTRNILEEVGSRRENLIPILQQIQEAFGYLPSNAMWEVAQSLNIPEIDVYSVATFYNQFRLTPPGKHSIRVCMGTACHVKGGHITLAAWQRRLKIESGETTPDREFDLDTVACVGCCAMAPVTVVDKKVEAKADPTRVDGILLQFQLQKEEKANH